MGAAKVTYEPIGQLLAPEEYDELPAGSRRELVDGVLYVRSTPAPHHQDVVQTGVFTGDDIVTAPGLRWAKFAPAELPV